MGTLKFQKNLDFIVIKLSNMNEVKPFMKVGIICADFHKKIICKRFNLIGKPFY